MRNLVNTIEKVITSIVAIGVLSMVLRLFIHIAMSHEFVWYQWLYVGFAGAMMLFVSAVIFTLILQAWKEDRV
jgi:hypothetical protein